MSNSKDQHDDKKSVPSSQPQPGKNPAGIAHEQHQQGPHGPAQHQGEKNGGRGD